MNHCVVDAARAGDEEAREKVAEAAEAIARLVAFLMTPPVTLTRIAVTGMTCAHCVASVTEELSELAGVESVDVVLETGEVTITSGTPLDPADIESAVAEAGYAVA